MLEVHLRFTHSSAKRACRVALLTRVGISIHPASKSAQSTAQPLLRGAGRTKPLQARLRPLGRCLGRAVRRHVALWAAGDAKGSGQHVAMFSARLCAPIGLVSMTTLFLPLTAGQRRNTRSIFSRPAESGAAQD